VGHAGVTAAVFAHVLFGKKLRENNGKAYAAQYVGRKARYYRKH